MNTRALGAPLVAILLATQNLSAQQQQSEPRRDRTGLGGMMGDQQRQMRMMDSMNARLDSMVARMNQGTGNNKMTRMAQVITEMVAQRKAMHQQMRNMMEQMMESHGGMMGRGDMMKMNDSPPPPAPRQPSRQDTTAADTGHAGHHPNQ